MLGLHVAMNDSLSSIHDETHLLFGYPPSHDGDKQRHVTAAFVVLNTYGNSI